MERQLRSFRVYPKKGREEVMNFLRFTIDPVKDDGYTITLYNSSDQPGGALGFDHIAAIVPQEQREGYYGYKVRLKNGKSFDVHASKFRVDQHRVMFYYGEDTIEEVYLARSEVFLILPVKGLAWVR